MTDGLGLGEHRSRWLDVIVRKDRERQFQVRRSEPQAARSTFSEFSSDVLDDCVAAQAGHAKRNAV
ncbi:MAG: hypothetical protein JOY61_22180 [Chloroflexi bacterium]|nr:hypothetical protein [Chloroflexota bacterium]